MTEETTFEPRSQRKPVLRVCIAVHAPISATETFIIAHQQLLPFDITVIEGWGADAASAGHTIRSRRLKNKPTVSFLEKAGRHLGLITAPAVEDTAIVAEFLRDERIDVVLAEYGTTAAAIAPACKLANVPLVAHFHGFDASRHSVILDHGTAYGKMFAYAARIIAVSNDMEQRLINLGCPPEKLMITRCGPRPTFMTIEPDAKSNRIIAVGRLVEKKAPHLLILAFQKVLAVRPELQLTIVGEGPMRPVCEDLIASLKIGRSVRLAGTMTPEEVRALMSRSFLFAQHSIVASDGDCEGTPVAVMEASAAALPVVATRHAGISDVVRDEETGLLVDEGDVSAMASAISALANDRGRARAMGLRGRERIAAHFSLERHIDELAAALQKAAAT